MGNRKLYVYSRLLTCEQSYYTKSTLFLRKVHCFSQYFVDVFWNLDNRLRSIEYPCGFEKGLSRLRPFSMPVIQLHVYYSTCTNVRTPTTYWNIHYSASSACVLSALCINKCSVFPQSVFYCLCIEYLFLWNSQCICSRIHATNFLDQTDMCTQTPKQTAQIMMSRQPGWREGWV